MNHGRVQDFLRLPQLDKAYCGRVLVLLEHSSVLVLLYVQINKEERGGVLDESGVLVARLGKVNVHMAIMVINPCNP